MANYMKGKIMRSYEKNDKKMFVIELVNLSDREKEIFDNKYRGRAYKMWKAGNQKIDVEDFIENYVKEHTTEEGNKIYAVEGFCTLGAYKWRDGEVIPADEKEINSSLDDATIAENRQKVLQALAQKEIMDSGISAEFDLADCLA